MTQQRLNEAKDLEAKREKCIILANKLNCLTWPEYHDINKEYYSSWKFQIVSTVNNDFLFEIPKDLVGQDLFKQMQKKLTLEIEMYDKMISEL